MNSLKHQVAVVTGASSGIGKAIALALAKSGADVGLVARRRDALEAVAGEVNGNGTRAHVHCTDLTNDADIENLRKELETGVGRVDILVLCGGAISHGKLENTSLAEFDLMYRSNLRGHYGLTQALLPLLRKQPGQIVFINSSAGLRSPASVGQFSATQHALRAVADSLRDEVNPYGIRVLSVFPGRTATPRMAALYEKEGRPYRAELLMQPEDVASMVVHALSLPRTAEVTDISMRPLQKSY
jgi:NADP-dependent 3-hydroxy acid dehydrogenase YdfG